MCAYAARSQEHLRAERARMVSDNSKRERSAAERVRAGDASGVDGELLEGIRRRLGRQEVARAYAHYTTVQYISLHHLLFIFC